MAAPWNYAAAGSKLTAAQNPVIALIGDSNFGADSSGVFPGFNKVLMAQNGSNSSEVLYGLQHMTWSKRPAVAVLMCGTNDLNFSPVPAPTTEANFNAMLALLKTKCDRVICLSIPPNEMSYPDGPHQAAVMNAALAQGVEYINLVPYFVKPGYTYDGIHLTAFGYDVLNTLIYFKIYNLL